MQEQEVDIKEVIKTVFENTEDLFCSSLSVSDEQKRKLTEGIEFIDEDLGNQKIIVIYLDELIARKVIDELINKVTLLKSKGLLKGIYKSYRYGVLDKNQVIVWFFYISDSFKDWSNEWIAQYINDDGKELDPNDQDWI